MHGNAPHSPPKHHIAPTCESHFTWAAPLTGVVQHPHLAPGLLGGLNAYLTRHSVAQRLWKWKSKVAENTECGARQAWTQILILLLPVSWAEPHIASVTSVFSFVKWAL